MSDIDFGEVTAYLRDAAFRDKLVECAEMEPTFVSQDGGCLVWRFDRIGGKQEAQGLNARLQRLAGPFHTTSVGCEELL